MPPRAWIPLPLIALTWLVYAQTLQFDFINYDDPKYVIDNPRMPAGLGLDNVRWSLSTFEFSNWHPLTWLSLLLDGQLFGIDAGGFHFTNVLLHTANVLLLYFVMAALTGAVWRSGFVAALFAVHPVNIEVVAWISARKDLLYFLFGVAAMAAYVRYARRLEGRWYVLSLALFFASLAAKQMLVTLPCVLLLLDYWPLQRTPWNVDQLQPFPQRSFGGLLLEKLPFFALALVLSVIAYRAQDAGGAVLGLTKYSLSTRLLNGVHSYVLYLSKTVWPVGLAIYYPHPGAALSTSTAALSAGLLIGLTAIAAWQWRQRPYLLVGWLWFLGTLVPVIQLVQVADKQMALRYLYFPLIGLFIAVTWWCCSLLPERPWRKAALGTLGVALLSALVAVSCRQTAYWRDSLTLFRHALAVTTNNAIAHTNLGIVLQQQFEFGAAIEQHGQAIRIQPTNELFRYNLAMTLLAQGRTQEAIANFEQAAELGPNSPLAPYQLGSLYHREGQTAEAVRWLKRAVEIDPNFFEARLYLGRLLLEVGDQQAAAVHLREALRLRPQDANAHEALREAED